jgi:hypothetical protein
MRLVRCPKCKADLPISAFPEINVGLKKGQRGKYCSLCYTPRTKEQIEQDRPLVLAWLTSLREMTPCAHCGGELVFWYKQDGAKSDLFKYANDGYSKHLLAKIVAVTTPLCDACAAKWEGRDSIRLARELGGIKKAFVEAKTAQAKMLIWKKYQKKEKEWLSARVSERA